MCDIYKTFWVAWDNHRIRLGKGMHLDQQNLIDYTDATPGVVGAIGFSRGGGGDDYGYFEWLRDSGMY